MGEPLIWPSMAPVHGRAGSLIPYVQSSAEFKDQILDGLGRVAAERAVRRSDPSLAERVGAVKAYQQKRFERSYADLLNSARYGDASRFFLVELYGPTDFTDRDREFERIVPKLVRMFPEDVLRTLVELALLHAETEQLDTAMACALEASSCGRDDYVRAWQVVGRSEMRETQLRRVLVIGRALDQFTQHAWIVTLLRMMRRPAVLAGLGRLQHFLESGLGAFRSMGGADHFLGTIDERERALLALLFSASLGQQNTLTLKLPGTATALEMLPP